MKERGTGRASGGKGPRPLDPARGASRTPDPGVKGRAEDMVPYNGKGGRSDRPLRSDTLFV